VAPFADNPDWTKGRREAWSLLQKFAANERPRSARDGRQNQRFSRLRSPRTTERRIFAADSLQMQQTPQRVATHGCRAGKQIKAQRRCGSGWCRSRRALLTSLLHVLA
jgi:hypothetical protein